MGGCPFSCLSGARGGWCIIGAGGRVMSYEFRGVERRLRSDGRRKFLWAEVRHGSGVRGLRRKAEIKAVSFQPSAVSRKGKDFLYKIRCPFELRRRTRSLRFALCTSYPGTRRNWRHLERAHWGYMTWNSLGGMVQRVGRSLVQSCQVPGSVVLDVRHRSGVRSQESEV